MSDFNGHCFLNGARRQKRETEGMEVKMGEFLCSKCNQDVGRSAVGYGVGFDRLLV